MENLSGCTLPTTFFYFQLRKRMWELVLIFQDLSIKIEIVYIYKYLLNNF